MQFDEAKLERELRWRRQEELFAPREKEMQQLSGELVEAARETEALSNKLQELLNRVNSSLEEYNINTAMSRTDDPWKRSFERLEMSLYRMNDVPYVLEQLSRMLPSIERMNRPLLYGCPPANDFNENEVLKQQRITLDLLE